MVGSTVLVQKNEALAHARMVAAFKTFSHTIETYGGIAHEIRGDALLAEFERASDAVSASLVFQTSQLETNAQLNDEIRPELRIGIALGEIIIADKTMTGAGVVLAQRLEQLADPGGVVIQSATYETLPKNLPFSFDNLGEQQLKGFDDPVRAYRVALLEKHHLPAPDSIEKAVSQPTTLELPDKPSIAVLPFTNMSGDADQEYFSDGISEDIITALSRMPWFFVIARNSSFTYKGQAVDIKKVAAELGVQYVLEGSVRKAGQRVRVTAQLIDALTDKHIWAGRYDKELADIFQVQDEVVESIVGEVAPEFLSAEAKRAQRADPATLSAWDCVMRGRWHLWRLSREQLADARVLFERAIELIPSGEFGASDLALIHALEAYYSWSDSRPDSLASMMRLAQQAVTANDHDPWAHTILGLANLFAFKHDQALPPLEHAISLYPNFAPALGIKNIVHACIDQPEKSHECLARARRLSPHDSLIPLWLLGNTWAFWITDDFDRSLATAQEFLRLAPDNPTARRQTAACLSITGQKGKAREMLQHYLELEPNHTADNIRGRLPSINYAQVECFIDALCDVGLPR